MFYSDFPALLPVICLCISVVTKTISSLHMAISKLKRICTDGEYSLYVLLFNHIIWVDSEICRVHCDGLFTKSSALPAAPGRVAEHFVNKSRM